MLFSPSHESFFFFFYLCPLFLMSFSAWAIQLSSTHPPLLQPQRFSRITEFMTSYTPNKSYYREINKNIEGKIAVVLCLVPIINTGPFPLFSLLGGGNSNSSRLWRFYMSHSFRVSLGNCPQHPFKKKGSMWVEVWFISFYLFPTKKRRNEKKLFSHASHAQFVL